MSVDTSSVAAPEPAAGVRRAPEPGPGPGRDRLPSLIRHVLLALAAYVPLVLTAPGRVAADTKTYLYLDPGRLLERAPSMWDPNIGLGTVTHQNIGYLFPMGPWYWAFERLGVPDWLAQRLWVATFMFAAGAGVLFLLHSLSWRQDPVADGGATDRSGGVGARLVAVTGSGALAAAAVYMLSPYVLNFGARLSVLLLPWAGLPWLIGLTQRALRSGSWRHPALFALVVNVIGGVNATALVLAGIGPLLWLPFAVWVHREVTLRRALVTTAKIGLLTVGCSLWWIAGLAVQGGYGIDILRYTESVRTVAATSLSSEVLRGLGYWFFYGGDKIGAWIEPGRSYTQSLWLIVIGFAVPGLAIVAAVVTRWRYRPYCIVLVLVGTAVGVGAYPYDSPSPVGSVFKAFATSSTAGLAMRSTARVVPLVVLGLALLVGSGVAALARTMPRSAAAAGGLVVLLAVAGLPPLWTGDFIGENLQRPEEVPDYWQEAAAYLDAQGSNTRVLEIPGVDFASYRWGTTVDPITPGLIDRPYAARELIPYGSAPSADLLNALDRRMHDGILDPDVLAPLARLMGVGDVLLRSDLEYERFRTPRPRALWALLEPAPAGLREPVSFGEPRPNQAVDRFPLRDEIELAVPADTPEPPPVAAFGVEGAEPIVRVESARRPLLLAGDGEGVVEAAAAGLLAEGAPLFYSASLAEDPELRARLLADGADLVLTDSNRRRGRRWSTVWENAGYTEPAGEEPLEEDLSDNRLPLFPDATDDAYTVAEQRGVRRVTATKFGNPVTYTPENRAANALDGNLDTAWRVGDFSPTEGERLLVELDGEVTTDEIEVVQPLLGPRDRYVTEVEVRLDGKDVGTFALDESSRRQGGQVLDIGEHTFSRFELVVRADNIGLRRKYEGLSPVGFAEVRVADVRVDEVLRLPSDLLDAAGDGSADHDLTVLLERQRGDAVFPGRTDEERSMVRAFSLPTARAFSLGGDARLSASLDDAEVDRLLGIPGEDEGGLTARSSSYLQGVLGSRASSALDGDRSTSWQTKFGEPAQVGAWIDVDVPTPVTFDRLDLSLVADGEHSVPTRLRIEGDGQLRTVEVPPVRDAREKGATRSVTVEFKPLTASRVRVVVEEVRPVRNIDYYSQLPVVRPIGVAELGIPGMTIPSSPEQFPDDCRDDLLEVDGRPVGLRLTGPAEDAAARSGLSVELCGTGEDELDLGAGDHLLRATQGEESGIDLDGLSLRSPASSPAPERGEAPDLVVLGAGRTSFDLAIAGATEPFWVVLGQSHSQGWTAEIEGGDSLGAPTVVNGFANGWYVDPQRQRDLRVSLEWTPQRGVWGALAASVAFGLLCLGIVAWGWRRAGATYLAAGSGAGPVRAELASPLAYEHDRRGRSAVPAHPVLLALACGLVAALMVSPVVGAIVLAAVAGSLRWGRRRGRSVLSVGSVVAFAVAAGYVLARQAWKGGLEPNFEWPSYFGVSHVLAWVAILLLSADVVVELARRQARVQTDPEV